MNQRRIPLGSSRRLVFVAQVVALVGLVVATGTAAGRSTKRTVRPAAPTTKKSTKTTAATSATQPPLAVYRGGLRSGWIDFGWSATRELGASSARIDMGNWQGWLLDRSAEPVEGTSVVVRYRTAADLGEFLQIGLTAVGQTDVGTEVPIAPSPAGPDGFRTATVGVAQFSPSLGFFQIRLRPTRALPVGTIVEVASIDVTPPSVATVSLGAVKSSGTATISIDCQTPARRPIDPRIYGIGYSGAGYLKADPSKMGATINRWGGNPTSRYNWKLGNVWNTNLDYFWRNVTIADGTTNALETFFAKNAEAGRLNAVTVPTLGWVAKDDSSYSFPVKTFGRQQASDPSNADIGNGRSVDGKKLPPPDPKTTSVAVGPDDIRQWVADSLKGRTNMYFLDNEVELWNDTHRDVHPAATTYDEVLDLGVRYATAIKAADSRAIVAGPASWGWPAYFYSAADAEAGFSSAPDRKAHGDTPLLAWYLQQMKSQEAKTGKRLLDVLDVHFYPQQSNVYGGGVGGVDPATAKLRIRSTRSLWDPSYTDESWIGESINLLPRMRKLITENYPGTGLSIGEWSFGGEGHMSGGLATAIALGRFGTEGVTSAFYWTAPPADSPTFWAFRAFRNFDGKGGRFLDSSVEAKSSNDAVSVFASTNEATSELVTVIINTDTKKALDTPIVTKNCRSLSSVATFFFDGGPAGFRGGVARDPARIVTPAYSITVVKGALR